MAATIALFLAWLWFFSDLSSFVQHVLVVGGEIGRSRLSFAFLTQALAFETAPNSYQVDMIGVVCGSIGLFFALSNAWGSVWRDIAPASTCALMISYFRSFAQASTRNEWQNSLAFLGLSACLGIGILVYLADHVPVMPSADGRETFPFVRGVKVCVILLMSSWVASMMLGEARFAWKRTIQEFGKFGTPTVFHDTLGVRGMEHVRWGEPTMINETTTLKRADFEQVLSYLKQKKSSFFVMGDSILFYGLAGITSPQPLLYFLPSHSFVLRDIPSLDRVVQASLEKNNVSLVVREKATYLPVIAETYKRFPRTWAWFTNQFTQVAEFGNYQIWERHGEQSGRNR